MDLRMARLCLDCEEIFEGKSRCPRCDSETWHPIMGWIRPMGEARKKGCQEERCFVSSQNAPRGSCSPVPPFRRRNRDTEFSRQDIPWSPIYQPDNAKAKADSIYLRCDA